MGILASSEARSLEEPEDEEVLASFRSFVKHFKVPKVLRTATKVGEKRNSNALTLEEDNFIELPHEIVRDVSPTFSPGGPPPLSRQGGSLAFLRQPNEPDRPPPRAVPQRQGRVRARTTSKISKGLRRLAESLTRHRCTIVCAREMGELPTLFLPHERYANAEQTRVGFTESTFVRLYRRIFGFRGKGEVKAKLLGRGMFGVVVQYSVLEEKAVLDEKLREPRVLETVKFSMHSPTYFEYKQASPLPERARKLKTNAKAPAPPIVPEANHSPGVREMYFSLLFHQSAEKKGLQPNPYLEILQDKPMGFIHFQDSVHAKASRVGNDVECQVAYGNSTWLTYCCLPYLKPDTLQRILITEAWPVPPERQSVPSAFPDEASLLQASFDRQYVPDWHPDPVAPELSRLPADESFFRKIAVTIKEHLELCLQLHCVHGDLSCSNVSWNGGEPVIFDFERAQLVEPPHLIKEAVWKESRWLFATMLRLGLETVAVEELILAYFKEFYVQDTPETLTRWPYLAHVTELPEIWGTLESINWEPVERSNPLNVVNVPPPSPFHHLFN